MKYSQYKGVVERTFNKPLGALMRELCIDEELTAFEGARRLGVAKEIFVYWRNHYRLDRKQLLFDRSVEELKKQKNKYADEVRRKDLYRPLLHERERSLQGLEEIVGWKLDYYKLLHVRSHGLDPDTAMIPYYEFAKELIERYGKGELKRDDNY